MDGVTLTVSNTVADADTEAVGVFEGVGVAYKDADTLTDLVGDLVLVRVPVFEVEGAEVGDALSAVLPVRLAVKEGVVEAEAVAVPVCDSVSDGVAGRG